MVCLLPVKSISSVTEMFFFSFSVRRFPSDSKCDSHNLAPSPFFTQHIKLKGAEASLALTGLREVFDCFLYIATQVTEFFIPPPLSKCLLSVVKHFLYVHLVLCDTHLRFSYVLHVLRSPTVNTLSFSSLKTPREAGPIKNSRRGFHYIEMGFIPLSEEEGRRWPTLV